ncbi:MAG TPA: hypothetical protein VHS34_20865 [Terriglobales bacterium]|jgi:hypothetical protein|nr:hypothetical protein [Terriglobales bacterium]
MKRHSIYTLAALVVALVLLVPRFAFSEPQPHMQEALRHLQAAANELQKASHDKGGHREKALQAVQDAIRHVNEGIRFDNTHRSQQDQKDRKYNAGQ